MQNGHEQYYRSVLSVYSVRLLSLSTIIHSFTLSFIYYWISLNYIMLCHIRSFVVRFGLCAAFVCFVIGAAAAAVVVFFYVVYLVIRSLIGNASRLYVCRVYLSKMNHRKRMGKQNSMSLFLYVLGTEKKRLRMCENGRKPQ